MGRASPWRTGLMAWVAGEIDAFGYLAMGQVFVSHMTGNTGVFVVAVVQHRWADALHRGLAIPFFVVGAAAGAMLVESATHRRQVARALLLEASLLIVFAAAQWATHGRAAHGPLGRPALLFALCGAMGLQNAVLTHAGVRGTHTTHVTGPLTDLTIDVVRIASGQSTDVDPSRSARLVARLVGFGVGAVSGAALYVMAPLSAPLVGAGVLVGVGVGEFAAA